MIQTYQTEDALITMYQEGSIGLVEFIGMHSDEWQEEYMAYCESEDEDITEESAANFLDWKDRQLELAIERGEA